MPWSTAHFAQCTRHGDFGRLVGASLSGIGQVPSSPYDGVLSEPGEQDVGSENSDPIIPEILSHPAIAGRAKTLSVPPAGKPAGRREEDVGNAKASRSRDSTEGWSPQERSGPFGGSVPVLC